MARMSKSALFLLPACLLAGCTLAPRHERPALPVPERFSAEPAAVEAGSSAPFMQAGGWKQYFSSPGLRDAIQCALDNNRDLRLALLNVEAARQLYRVEKNDLYPGIRGEANASRQKITRAQGNGNPNFAGRGDSTTSEYDLKVAVVSYELDLFGRVRSESDRALETYLAGTAAKSAAQTALVAATAQAYLQWLADVRALQLLRDIHAAQQRSLAIIEASHRQGLASKLDLANMQAALAEAGGRVATAQWLLGRDEGALALLMGRQGAIPDPDTSAYAELLAPGDLPVGLPSQVLLARPDVVAAEHELKAANANIGAARARLFPRIALTGSYGFASGELSDLLTRDAAGAWNFAPQATVPIFDRPHYQSLLKVSKVHKEMAVARYERAIQAAFYEVSDALRARETIVGRIKAHEALLEAAQRACELAAERYEQGLDGLSIVLDAERRLIEARLAELELQRLQLANRVSLYKALGGGI